MESWLIECQKHFFDKHSFADNVLEKGKAMQQDVPDLSDDDGAGTVTCVNQLSDDEPSENHRAPAASSSSGFRKRAARPGLTGEGLANVSKRLRFLVGSNCKCKDKSCRKPFQSKHAFEELLQLRVRLHQMDKQDMDQEAFADKIYIHVFRV